jgi:periplasmic copper chaperone A
MNFARIIFATCAVIWTGLAIAAPGLAHAEGIVIQDAYFVTSGVTAKSGAAFMHIVNTDGHNDRLIGVASDVAARVELHGHILASDGVMLMRPIEGGVELPAGQMHGLERGGDHVMFMGLKQSFTPGDVINLTLIFEVAGEVSVQIPLGQPEQDDANAMEMEDD